MAKRIKKTTPKQDGFRMPGEYEPQEKVWMIWPERPDNWRDGGKPAQEAFTEVAKAISRFTPMNVVVSQQQFQNCRRQLPEDITVYEMSNNDAWIRDCGPSFVINDKGELRGNDWGFNAWGGLVDGLYFPWDQDDLVAQKICEIEHVDSYRTDDFILEGGSFHVDGEGTVLVTEMCLLSEGRNPHMSKEEIEQKLCDYLNCEKVLWLGDGIDPEETNGHVDDVACFVRPGEVACIYTEDKNSPFYEAAQDAYKRLSEMTDAKGRKLIHAEEGHQHRIEGQDRRKIKQPQVIAFRYQAEMRHDRIYHHRNQRPRLLRVPAPITSPRLIRPDRSQESTDRHQGQSDPK